MGPEVLVLGRDEGLLHHVGDRRVRHEDAPLGGQLGQQARVAGIDAAHHRRLVVAQAVDVRQVGAEVLPGEIANASADQHRPAGQSRARRPPRRARIGGSDWRRLRRGGGGCGCRLPAWLIAGGLGRQRFAGCQGSAHGSPIWPFSTRPTSNEIASQSSFPRERTSAMRAAAAKYARPRGALPERPAHDAQGGAVPPRPAGWT